MDSKKKLIIDMQKHLDNLTKPVGSLGDLESFAMKLAIIQRCIPPVIEKKASFVFAGDHGVTEEGVSLYPKEVTYQMVLNFLSGGAGINVLSKYCGYDVYIVNAGVSGKFDDDGVIARKVGHGTRNFVKEPAMSEEQLEQCLQNGKDLAKEAIAKGYDLFALGDMGIGNTTTAAALLIASRLPADDVIDRGTGIDDKMLERKRQVIQKAVSRYAPYKGVRDIMRQLGGFEICTITGFILGLKGQKAACVLDGFPVTTAGYMAWLIDREVKDFLFAGHKSKVKGHAVVLERMGLKPIVDLNMRLGEGTGAVIGGFLISLGAKIAGEMASFESADVSRSEGVEEDY